MTDGPNTTQPDFYVFDIASGLQVGTIPSPFTGSGTFAGAAYVSSAVPVVPEPSTVVGVSVLALLALCRWRR